LIVNWLKSIVGWLGCGANPFDQMLRQRDFPARMAGEGKGIWVKTEIMTGEDSYYLISFFISLEKLLFDIYEKTVLT
jgi:hypothetical protein